MLQRRVEQGVQRIWNLGIAREEGAVDDERHQAVNHRPAGDCRRDDRVPRDEAAERRRKAVKVHHVDLLSCSAIDLRASSRSLAAAFCLDQALKHPSCLHRASVSRQQDELQSPEVILFYSLLLNASWFLSLADARDRIEAWRIDYNTERPHSASGQLTLKAFARQAALARKVS